MAQSKKSASKSNFLASPVAKVAVAVAAVGLIAATSITAYTFITKSSAGAAGAETCGSGYKAFDSKNGTYASIQTYYNAKAKKFCSILVATGKAAGGKKKPMSITAAKGGSDSGSYQYYAGPVLSTMGGASGSMTFEGKTYNYVLPPPPQG